MEIIFRPLTVWPGNARSELLRKTSPFSASYGDTLKLLDRELRMLAARNVTLSLALQSKDIRVDGLPRHDARPSHPGVILGFDSKHGPLSYPCDVFPRWEDNLRAIALSLEHLRAVDRYGVTQRGEQYQGWAALPAPKMGKVEATQFLQRYASESIDSDDKARAAYRVAALRLHPDRGGEPEEFKRLQEAKEALGL